MTPRLGDTKHIWTRWFSHQVKTNRPSPYFNACPDSQLNQIIWINPRPNNGFQIKILARNIIIESGMDHWTLKISHQWTSRIVVLMGVVVKSPWFLNTKSNHMTLVDKEFASMLAIFDGDIQTCLTAIIK